MLAGTLAQIFRDHGAPETAAEGAMALSPGDLWQVAVIHLAGLIRREPALVGTRWTGSSNFNSFVTRLVNASSPHADIFYPDCGVGFHAEGLRITNHDGPRMLSAMLCLLYYARFHSDTLVYLPHDMRARRFEELAGTCGASIPFIRFICARFPVLERTVIT
jgi:hypothetical protein